MKISPSINPVHVDLLQESKIKWLIAGLGALGGIVALLVYFDQKKHNAVEKEIFALVTICDSTEVGTCCGGCRQRVREFAKADTSIYACGPDGVRAIFTMEQLLPTSFGPDNLVGFIS